ncbi:hypothetical protein [Vibrio sp.]|uniref:hypothetical protein n=1 Tax=Vibrio sp. TaxID=678 RepID=UPI003AA7B180
MFLVKSCYKQDNVICRNTLKIGTLDDYRLTEIKEIADKFEGCFKYELDLYNAHIDEKTHLELTESCYGFTHIIYDSMIRLGYSHPINNSFFYKQYKATIYVKHNNRFVFCFSLIDKHEDSTSIFNNYDVYWHFKSDRMQLVCSEIASYLRKHIVNLELRGIKVFEGEYSPSDLVVHYKAQNIAYMPRNIHIDNKYFYERSEEILQIVRGVSYIKPDSYKHEKEVRITFDFYADRKILHPKIKNIIIPIENKFLDLVN